ncbi:MAG: hypothetical protein JL50_02125 [Peptococcaceae bacterium BICA1-7]|nr:MAG: hypothetical protein JL50_02125 [Peptococcaceae bacterium BICA1-7]HBV95424.1 hypothetical protein [Desulfotomaculum sp.]
MRIKFTLFTIFMALALSLAGCAKKEEAPEAGTPVESVPTESSTVDSSSAPTETQPSIPVGVNDPISAQTPRSITSLSSLPEVVASDSVEIKGKTRPGFKVYIEGQEVFPNIKGEFSFKQNLQVGKNELKVITLGKEKIEETKTLAIERRPVPPMLTVVPPALSDSEFVTINGQTEKGCIVYVNATPTMPDREGKFTSSVQLKEGDNNITITSTNRDGGTAALERTIAFTPPDPMLEVIIPDTANSKQVTISGITDNNTALVLYVNEVKSSINQQNGTFSSTLTLEDGLNEITVTAINKWGKKATVSGSIFLYSTS